MEMEVELRWKSPSGEMFISSAHASDAETLFGEMKNKAKGMLRSWRQRHHGESVPDGHAQLTVNLTGELLRQAKSMLSADQVDVDFAVREIGGR